MNQLVFRLAEADHVWIRRFREDRLELSAVRIDGSIADESSVATARRTG